jgi:multidrug efflux pump subunit AcrA (membrane-fusion protein)
MKPVTAGGQIGDLTVIAQGLDVGERVVTDGQGKLAPGATVDIKGETGGAS